MSYPSKLVLLAASILLSSAAFALTPGLRLTAYNRQIWTVSDGVPSSIGSMAQTPDGWLWLGTQDGLYRFDGERFQHYQLPGKAPLSRIRIPLVHAEHNGDLWFSYTGGGLSVLRRSGRQEDFVDSGSLAIGLVRSLAIDTDGSVWAAASNGVFHYVDRTWRTTKDVQGQEIGDVNTMLLDQQHRLWVNGSRGPYLLDRASGQFRPIGHSRLYGSLTSSPDGAIWVVTAAQTALLAPAQGVPRSEWSNQVESRLGGQFDRDGNLWSLRCRVRECSVLVRPDQRSIVSPTTTLSLSTPPSAQLNSATLEDREGNIWVAGPSGLERFRDNKLLPAGLPSGIGVFSMARDANGQVWAAERDSGVLWQLSASTEPRAVPGFYPVVANDRDGALLLAGKRMIERRFHGHISELPLPPGPDGQPRDLTVLGMQDDGRTLWMASLQTGLMGYQDGKWQTSSALKLPHAINLGAVGEEGQLWLSLDDGRLIHWDSGRSISFDALRFGLASGIFVGKEVVFCGNRGMAVLQGEQLQQLHADDPEALLNISGMVETPDGDRWFNGGKGVVHVQKKDWRAALEQPDHLLRYELLDAREGYLGRATLENRLPSAVRGGDGQLWFRGSGGIVHFDPRRQSSNPVAPAVEISALNAGAAIYSAGTDVRLPPGTQSFNIRYTANGLRHPASLRFQYRLMGIDQQWQDSTARVAYYTNIGPGSYTFLVKAANEDGVGTDQASMRLEIAPTLTQATWFKLLCVTLACLLLYGLYRYRLKTVARHTARTLAVKMAERERIARTLHDTLLQSVQNIILRLHMLSDDLPANSLIQSQLRGWLERADHTLGRGRDQVHELRSSVEGDLPAALQETGRTLAELYPHISFTMKLAGAATTLPLWICEEVSEIGREALRNAFQHSGATMIEASLRYEGAQMWLEIGDDGQGIASNVLSAGRRTGRWGLTGMRERAAHIGAHLSIDSPAGQGTTVRLSLTLSPPDPDWSLQSLMGRLFGKRPSSLLTPTLVDED